MTYRLPNGFFSFENLFFSAFNKNNTEISLYGSSALANSDWILTISSCEDVSCLFWPCPNCDLSLISTLSQTYSCSCYRPLSSSRPSSLTACRKSICLRCLSPRQYSSRKIPRTSRIPQSWTPAVSTPSSPSRLCPWRTGTTSCLILVSWLLRTPPVTLCWMTASIHSWERILDARLLIPVLTSASWSPPAPPCTQGSPWTTWSPSSPCSPEPANSASHFLPLPNSSSAPSKCRKFTPIDNTFSTSRSPLFLTGFVLVQNTRELNRLISVSACLWTPWWTSTKMMGFHEALKCKAMKST